MHVDEMSVLKLMFRKDVVKIWEIVEAVSSVSEAAGSKQAKRYESCNC